MVKVDGSSLQVDIQPKSVALFEGWRLPGGESAFNRQTVWTFAMAMVIITLHHILVIMFSRKNFNHFTGVKHNRSLKAGSKTAPKSLTGVTSVIIIVNFLSSRTSLTCWLRLTEFGCAMLTGARVDMRHGLNASVWNSTSFAFRFARTTLHFAVERTWLDTGVLKTHNTQSAFV